MTIADFELYMLADNPKVNLKVNVDGTYRVMAVREAYKHWANGRDFQHSISGRVVAEYEEVLDSKRELTRQIDQIINGDQAAKQASLCDLVPQIAALVRQQVKWRSIAGKPPRKGQFILWYSPSRDVRYRRVPGMVNWGAPDFGIVEYRSKEGWNEGDLWLPLNILRTMVGQP